MNTPAIRRAFLAMADTCAVVSKRSPYLHDAVLTIVTRDGFPIGACRRHARHLREVAAYGVTRRGPQPLAEPPGKQA